MIKTKYFLQLSSSYLLIITSIVVSLLLIPYLTAKLGSVYYGLWVLLSSIISYFTLSGLGFGTTLLKEVSSSQDSTNINKYITTTLIFFLGITFILFFVFMILSYWFEDLFLVPSEILPLAKEALTYIFMGYIVVFISSVFNTILFAKGMLYIQNIITVINVILTALLYYIILDLGYSIVEMSLAYLCVTIITSSFSVYFAMKNVKFSIKFKYFDSNVLREMLTPSLHYFLISVGAVIILNSDNIMISSFIGLSAVATYSIGYKLVDISQRLLFKVVDVLIPDIALLYKEGKYKNVLLLHNKILFYSMIMSIIGYSILYFFGLEILKLWVGKEFTISPDIFRLFILFGFIHTWVHVSAIFVVAMGVHKETSYMGIFDALLNILFSIVLLQYYGLLGVALGTLLSHIVTSGWFATWWFYKQINLKINENSVNG